MTDVTTRYQREPVTGPARSAATVPSKPAQTLITEQQVLLSTAAAAAPAPQPYPKRHVWLENSLMSREMDRL